MDYDIWPDDPQDATRQSLKRLHVHNKSELALVCFAATYCLPELSRHRDARTMHRERAPAGPVAESTASSAHLHPYGIFRAGKLGPECGYQLYGCRIERSGEAPLFLDIVRLLPRKWREVVAMVRDWHKRPPRDLVVWFVIRRGADGLGRICFLGATAWREYAAQQEIIESALEMQAYGAVAELH